MKKSKFEDFVKNNRHEFDRFTPSDSVWARINEELNQKPVVQKWYRSWQPFAVAAGIVLLLGFSVMIGYRYSSFSKQFMADDERENPLLNELKEAENYYNVLLNDKLKEVKACTMSSPDVYNQVIMDITELNEMYSVLKKDLKDNMASQEVIEAMIRNYQVKLQILENVLNEIRESNGCDKKSDYEKSNI